MGGQGKAGSKSEDFLGPTDYSIDRDLPKQIEVREHLAGAEHDGRQRILGDLHRQTGLVAQTLVEVLQQRAAAAQHDAAIADVGGELWRNALERVAHGLHHLPHRLGERFADLVVVERDGRTACPRARDDP